MASRRNGAAPAAGASDSAAPHSQLRERLLTLRGAFKIIEPPQLSPVDGIERAYENHWIQVQVDLPQRTYREQRNYWALLRDTLSLISAMAVVDHEICVELLATAGEMVVPAPLDLSKQRLNTRFILDFGDRQRQRERDREDYGSRETGCLWSQFETLFQRETAVRVTITIREALRQSGAESLPIETGIRINFELEGEGATELKQSEMLGRLTEAIAQAQEHSRSQTSPHVRLKFESIYLDLGKICNHTSPLNATTEVLKTGITIDRLCLPSYISFDRHSEADKTIARANLLCAVFDNPANLHSSRHRTVNVRGFVAPLSTMSTPRAYESFFSALVGSRQLKALYLRTLENTQDDFAMKWLAYALFSKHSTAPVEMLLLARLDLDDQLIDGWASVIKAENPLQLLPGMADEAPPAETTSGVPQAVTIPSQTTIRLRGSNEDILVQLPCAWDGVVIDNNATKRTLQVLLPGFGICTVDHEALPNKRARIVRQTARTPSAVTKALPLRHLFVRLTDRITREQQPDGHSTQLFSRVMGLLGPGLTALRVTCDGWNVQELVDGIVQCPHLQTLDLFAGDGATMDGLLELYNRGCQISSLDVMSISAQSLEDLLEALTIGSTHPIYTTLKKLRLRDLPLHSIQASIMQKLIQVARENRVLLHVEMDRFGQLGSLPFDEFASCDGQVEVQVEPFPMALRYTFLDTLHKLSHNREAFRLPVDAIASIFEFAAPTQPRIVRVDDRWKSITWW